MLHLQSESTQRWLAQVDQNLPEILIDHAHCERKAASTAMNLMNSYTENRSLCVEMTRIIQEELEHYHMVIDVLDRRGIAFRRLASGHYGRQLNALTRQREPLRAVDRLLIASLIEAAAKRAGTKIIEVLAPASATLSTIESYTGMPSTS